MRNVTPPSDPDILLRQMQGQDDLKKYMAAAWRQIMSELRMFLSDTDRGLYNRIEHVRGQMDHTLYQFEQNMYTNLSAHKKQIAETIGPLAQQVSDLKQKIDELEKQKIRKKKSIRWRGVPSREEWSPLAAA